jgi:hypothetical protein
MMMQMFQAYHFEAVFELTGFKLPTSRKSDRLLGLLQSLLRHRHDARLLLSLLKRHLADSRAVEVWTDEPLHYPMRFLHGLFPDAVHVKFPHAFNLEDRGSAAYRNLLADRFRKEATWMRRIFWLAIRLSSGVHYNLQHGIQFDRAYTFDAPSPWSNNSVDLSHLIDAPNMNATYARLPLSLRREVEQKIRYASPVPDRPWALLLLFGLELDENARNRYRQAITRIQHERPEALAGRQLVLKPHPLNRSRHPQLLADELAQVLHQPVTLFDCTLNLDILWSVVPAKLVLAGPCGALPIIRRSSTARAVILRELFEHMVTRYPHDKKSFELAFEDCEVW